jgi:TolA-binding protein
LRSAICNWIAPLTFVLPALVRADTLWVSSGGGAIQIQNAKIVKLEGDTIFFTANGTDSKREISKIQRLAVDGEQAFNTAEEAFVGGRWDPAADGYQKSLAATNKSWLKDYATIRLLEAANKSGRFDAAATAYVALVTKDPAANVTRPTIPEQKSAQLDTAVAQVNAALQKKLSDQQQTALLGFLVDLQRARGDNAAEKQAAEKLDEILAKDPNNPAATQIIARRKLQSAQEALAAKDFPKAISEIESNRQRFSEPQQQADALFVIAQARYGLAQPTKDATALKDAGLAFMRVVANFKDLPAHPHVVESLMQTAAIQEQLNEPQTAAQIYAQVAEKYPDDPAAAAAKQNAVRLNNK